MRALSHLGWSTPRRIPQPALEDSAPRGRHCRGQGRGQERCTRGDRHAGGLRARGQGDRRIRRPRSSRPSARSRCSFSSSSRVRRGPASSRTSRSRASVSPSSLSGPSARDMPGSRPARWRSSALRRSLQASINGYIAAAATGALLTFVLPVTLPAPNSAIPERLAGWGLAAGAGISALMLLWPPRQRADLQREAAGALRAVADQLDADRESWAERARVARASVDALGRRLLGTRHRPTGPTGPMAALASIPDELDWLLSFLTPVPEGGLELACAEDAEALAAAAGTLRVERRATRGPRRTARFRAARNGTR